LKFLDIYICVFVISRMYKITTNEDIDVLRRTSVNPKKMKIIPQNQSERWRLMKGEELDQTHSKQTRCDLDAATQTTVLDKRNHKAICCFNFISVQLYMSPIIVKLNWNKWCWIYTSQAQWHFLNYIAVLFDYIKVYVNILRYYWDDRDVKTTSWYWA